MQVVYARALNGRPGCIATMKAGEASDWQRGQHGSRPSAPLASASTSLSGQEEAGQEAEQANVKWFVGSGSLSLDSEV